MLVTPAAEQPSRRAQAWLTYNVRQKMTTTVEDIISFLHEITRIKKNAITPDSDLYSDLGIDGDDWDDLLLELKKRFGVNIEGYRWYFHHGEEGFNPFALIFRPPNWRVKRIPITPKVLLECVELGRWSVVYPEHKLPKIRYDIAACRILALLILVLSVGGWLYSKFLK